MPENLDQPLQGKVYVSPNKAIGQWVTRLLKAYKDADQKEAIALLPLDQQAER